MTTTNSQRIGGVALAAALVVAALVAATAPNAVARHGENHPVPPGGPASNNCVEEFELSWNTTESGSLDAVTNEEDIWKSDVPTISGDAQLDVTVTRGGPVDVELYNKTARTCSQIDGTVRADSDPEFTGLDDDQTYYPHVLLADSTAEYDIIMEPE